MSRLVQRWEHAIGAERPGRPAWVWLGPLINVVGTFALVMWLSATAQLDWIWRLPLALFAAFAMGSITTVYLIAFASDAKQTEEEEREAQRRLGSD